MWFHPMGSEHGPDPTGSEQVLPGKENSFMGAFEISLSEYMIRFIPNDMQSAELAAVTSKISSTKSDEEAVRLFKRDVLGA